MDGTTETAAGRGSRDVWLDAAYEALLQTGVDSVRIQPLAKRLALSRTSFYWFFKDRDQLLGDLLERWKATNTGAIVRRSQAYADSASEAMLNVFDCWLDPQLFDARFEFAVRSWALQSEIALAEVQRADHERMGALQTLFERFGFTRTEADVRARTVYLVQIGYISMQTSEPAEARLARIPDYVSIFTGTAPTPRELDRFRSRHLPGTIA